MDIITNIIDEYLKAKQNAAYSNLIPLLISIIVAGIILITINAASHYYRERISERGEKRRIVKKNLKPVMDAVEKLISRIMEILVQFQRTTIQDINHYNRESFKNRIPKFCNDKETMNRHESTAYRLFYFLTLLRYFQKQTSEVTDYDYLDDIRYFTESKIPVGLRGNLYGFKCLSSQIQERVSSLLFDLSNQTKGLDFSFSTFLNVLSNNENIQRNFLHLLDFLNINIAPLKYSENINTDSSIWKHILTLCHATVYLIDFNQDFSNEPIWEEYRVYLVRMIIEWNKNNLKQSYLYSINDLTTANYLDTFPSTVLLSYPIWKRFIRFAWQRFAWSRRRGKYFALKRRGKRFIGRHYRKEINKNGVKIYPGKIDKIKHRAHFLHYNEELKTLYNELMHYLETEKRIVV